MPEVHQLIEARAVFFANRVDTYARIIGLNNAQVIDHLQEIADIYGKTAVTSTIDQIVPAELHSSRMPV